MFERRFFKARLAVTGGLVTAVVLSGATAAAAHDPDDEPVSGAPAAPSPVPRAGTVFLLADLSGTEEVPVTGGPASGDQDGEARVVVRIQGNQVCFTAEYAGIAAPTAGHIHAGVAGANGGVKVGFFGTALPSSLRAVTGCVAQEAATVEAIIAAPEKHYVNLHTAEYPGGAVRGQLRKLDKPVDLLEPLRGGLVALLDGTQEVPVLGDPDGRGTGFVQVGRRQLDFAFTWTGIAPPTAGHLHPGLPGAANPLAVELFDSPGGLPASLLGVAGTIDATRAVIKSLDRGPQNFYLNLHNAEFAKGAVRGQLFEP
jgi:hypothetical protein